jgi:hypothetical protein
MPALHSVYKVMALCVVLSDENLVWRAPIQAVGATQCGQGSASGMVGTQDKRLAGMGSMEMT